MHRATLIADSLAFLPLADITVGVVPRQHIRILCVDDSPGVGEMLKQVLDAAGYDVELASNGFQALNRISRDPNRYPLVITDIRMPGLDGYSLISQSRAAGYGGPFIVLAGMLSPDDRQRLRELRVTAVLEKPSRRTEILDAVSQARVSY